MKLDEAIKILKPLSEYITNCYEPETKPAIQLGIEALKRIQYWRDTRLWGAIGILPGETEETGK